MIAPFEEVIMPKSRISRASRWTPAQARVMLEELACSGLSVHRFAAKRRLGAARLYRWKRQLQRPNASAAPRFAEVTVGPAAPPAMIEMELPGGVALRVCGGERVDDVVSILSRLPVR